MRAAGKKANAEPETGVHSSTVTPYHIFGQNESSDIALVSSSNRLISDAELESYGSIS